MVVFEPSAIGGFVYVRVCVRVCLSVHREKMCVGTVCVRACVRACVRVRLCGCMPVERGEKLQEMQESRIVT
jgi:hypothetical protein